MTKIYTVFFLVFTLLSGAKASHIVGGEFELLHQTGFDYRLNLILYFDKDEGIPDAKDNNIIAAIFRKRDNLLVDNVTLTLRSEETVQYTNPSCRDTHEVNTDRLLYSAPLRLNESRYSDPEGYYVVWERCCRNYTITNAYSENPGPSSSPDLGAIYAGQTYYLEFPPVVKDGMPFINSSPKLFPPLSDFGCPFLPYYADFAGTDEDGDSLVYSLVAPLNSSDREPIPTPSSRPHTDIRWRDDLGFGLDNVMKGSPRLSISNDGFLTVTPTVAGLFVFAVKCEEYRSGEKIGEVRRDFQFVVVSNCASEDPPVIKGKRITDTDFTFVDNMAITFDADTPDDERCIQVEVSDPDALDDLMGPDGEILRIRAIPLNFETDDLSELLPSERSKTLNRINTTATFDVCFPKCPYLQDEPYEIGIIIEDDACALPLSDTLVVTVTISQAPNAGVFFEDGDLFALTRNEIDDGFYTRDFTVRDVDGDRIELKILPEDFLLSDFGMNFETIKDESGELVTRFSWGFDCRDIDFNDRTEFKVQLIADDIDNCLFAGPDTLTMDLTLILPPNEQPEVLRVLGIAENATDFRVESLVNRPISIEIKARDADADSIVLEAIGANFDMEALGATFSSVRGKGVPGVSSVFDWNLGCEFLNLVEQDSFRVYFFAEDIDRCQITNRDTLTMDVIVRPRTNTAPRLSFSTIGPGQSTVGNKVTVTRGAGIHLRLTGVDIDNDPIKLELSEVVGSPLPTDFSFENKMGRGTVSSDFLWTPDCEVFTDLSPLAEYQLKFRLSDEPCFDFEEELLTIDVEINDVDSQEDEFLPPNFFSPNGDAYNPYFAAEVQVNEGDALTVRNNLPKDNCAYRFEHIAIMNRWGKQVFFSRDRNFRWFGEGYPTGVYFYYIQFTNKKSFRGHVTLSR